MKEKVVNGVPAVIDWDTMASDEVLAAMKEEFAKKTPDMKLIGNLSKLYTKKEAEAEKAKRDALQAELAKTTQDVKNRFDALAAEIVASGVLDGADGIWYAKDFGEKLTSCRITKPAKHERGTGEGSGKSSYIANPAKSADLLAQVGDHVYLKEDTVVTIDKVEQTLPAGTTFKKAFEHSTNGAWRNRVRMALLKEAGVPI